MAMKHLISFLLGIILTTMLATWILSTRVKPFKVGETTWVRVDTVAIPVDSLTLGNNGEIPDMSKN